MDRQNYLIDFTLGSLARRKGRNLGLLTVYAAIVFLVASVMLFTHAIRREAALVLAHAPDLVIQRLMAGRHDLIPPAYLEAASTIRGVQSVERRVWGYFYDPVVSANYTLMAPAANAPAPGSIVVGNRLAAARGLQPGNTISFRAYSGQLFSFTVAQVLPEHSEIISADLVLMAESDLRAFFGIPAGHCTDLALRVSNPLEVRTVAAKIAALAPDSRTILREDILRTYASVFQWREGIVLTVLIGAVLAFAILAWDKASGLSAEERREIGTLKAIGWESADILAMKAWEGGLLSLLAFLLGTLGAYLHVFHADALLFEPVLKGWSVLYPHFALVPQLDGVQLLTLLFLTVLPYTLATMVPIWRAAVTEPDSVLRN